VRQHRIEVAPSLPSPPARARRGRATCPVGLLFLPFDATGSRSAAVRPIMRSAPTSSSRWPRGGVQGLVRGGGGGNRFLCSVKVF
jgi:hypothetical protein